MLVCDPFRMPDQQELVKEAIGLANAEVDGPRYILFGVNPGAMDGSKIVGIAESAMTDLKKAHRLLSSLIEPVLPLAFIFDRIDSKLVGALEIDGCDEGPYSVGEDFSEQLTRGQAWIREGRELRAVDSAELAREATPEVAEVVELPPIEVGFNDEPECKLVELPVPDTSNPPFAHDKQNVKKPLDLKKTIRDKVSTLTTQILRLGRSRSKVSAGKSDELYDDSSTDVINAAESLFDDADNHYYYEEKALQLNLVIRNEGEERVEGVTIELGFPRLPDFDVADRLYVSPFDKRSPNELKNLGYPEVEHRDDAILVRSTVGVLDPDSPVPAFRCPLRLRVGPGMRKRKLAILYTLRAANARDTGKGRLKIKFGEVSA